MGPWRIYEVNGSYTEFSETLDRTRQGALDRHIARLAERGPLIAEEGRQSRKIKGYDNLYELRPRNVRMFYCFIAERSAVLLLGVIKDQPRLRKEVYERANLTKDRVLAMEALQWNELSLLN